MFSMDQLGYFKESNPSLEQLKPWWDVFTDYITIAMFLLAVLTGTKQATSSSLYCLPAVDCSSSMNQSVPAFGNNNYCKDINQSVLTTKSKTVLIKLQNQGQYDFVHAKCKQEAVHGFVSYFPFIIFLETVLLIVVSNFWLKYPPTLSKMKNFVILVNECHNTPGTCLVVFNTLWETALSDYVISGSEDFNFALAQPANSTYNQEQVALNAKNTASLELSEANKVKTLHEKVRKFQDDNENKNLIYIYLIQAIVKSVLSFLSSVINAKFYSQLKNNVMCKIDDVISENYNNNYFKCVNDLVPFYKVVFMVFSILIVLYFILCVWACVWWICFRKNKYDFSQHLIGNQANELGEIKDAYGDLAFMLYLLDLYNKLYSYRFAVFLSDKNEQRLKDFILTNIWPLKKLQENTKDCGRTLILPDLHGIPKTVFEMFAVDKLVLENCTLNDSDFKIDDWKKLNLRSLSLINCSLIEIPSVIFELHTLESLDLSRNNIQSIPRNIQDLKQLKIFNIIRNNITEGVEHIIAMTNLTANLCENGSLKLGYSNGQPIELLKLYIHEVNIKDEAKPAFENFATQTTPIFDVHVVKYSSHQTPKIEQENVYGMMSNRKGLVLLFSNLPDPLIERERLASDNMLLDKLFKKIGYEAMIDYADNDASNTLNNFKKKLSENLNGYKYESLIIVFLGHGTKEGMCLYRGEVMSVETIVDILKNIQSLQGKPKLIIIQAWLDPTFHRTDPTDKEAQECLPEYTLNVDRPACDDVVIAYSTLQSVISPPGSEQFSWFVRALVDVFSHYAWKEDVLSLLKLVNDELYRKCIVRKAYKHVSPPQSTLTKKWYLFPGFSKPDDSVRSQPSTVV